MLINFRASSSALLIIAMTATNLSAEPQKNKQKLVTIDYLVDDILVHNPELKLYENEIDAAKGERITAEKWENPQLSTSLGNQHKSGSSGDDGALLSIAMYQTFEWPGRRDLRKLIADKEIDLADLELKKFRSALTQEAQLVVFDLLSVQEKVSATKEVASRYEDLSNVLEKRDIPGVNPQLERRIILATALSLSREIVENEIELKKAQLRLNELRGEPLETTIRIKSSKLHLKNPPHFELLVEAASENNINVHMKQAELIRQNLKVDLAKNERNPAISVGPYLNNQRAGEQETQIGVSVSMPLFLWDNNEGHIASEQAHKEQAVNSVIVTQLKVEREIAESLEIYKLRLKEMQKADGLSIEEFKKAASLADEHYRLGAVPVTTYVELQKQYLEAVETTLGIKKDALKARQQLEQLTGLNL